MSGVRDMDISNYGTSLATIFANSDDSSNQHHERSSNVPPTTPQEDRRAVLAAVGGTLTLTMLLYLLLRWANGGSHTSAGMVQATKPNFIQANPQAFAQPANNASHQSILNARHKSWNPNSKRLPTTITPTHYTIEFTFLDPKTDQTDTYTGNVSILLKCTGNTDKIILHSNPHFVIATITLTAKKGNADTKIQNETVPGAFLAIKPLNGTFVGGDEYILNISFSAKLYGTTVGKPQGLFKDLSTNGVLVGAMFEPTFASSAFPCFDEPNLRTTFDLIINKPSYLTAISSTAAQSTTDTKKIFSKTLPMSTYSFGFALLSYSSKTSGKTIIWYRTANDAAIENLHRIVNKMIQFSESYFKKPLPLQELHIVCTQQHDQAESSLGIIYVPEKNALLNQSATPRDVLRSYLALSHEIAHQWLGHMVSLRWWNELWLKEALSTFMSYKAMPVVLSEVDALEYVLAYNFQTLQELEYNRESRPLGFADEIKADISYMYDPILYQKGPFVFRMIENVIGAQQFGETIAKFAAVSDGIGSQEVFLKILQASQTQSPAIEVTGWLSTWIYQAGYPIVNVTAEKNGIRLTQSNFFIYPSNSNTLWNIPVSYISASTNTPAPVSWFTEKTTKIDMATTQWIIINPNMTVYFKVNYDIANWDSLIKQLIAQPTAINSLDRARILDDSMKLCRYQYLSCNISMAMTEYIDRETNVAPWMAFFTNLKEIDTLLRLTKIYDRWPAYVLRKLQPLIKSVGLEDVSMEKSTPALLRPHVVYWSCVYNDPVCLQKSKQMADSLRSMGQNANVMSTLESTKKHIAVDLVICNDVKQGGDLSWNFWFSVLHLHQNDSIAALKIASGMSCSTDVNKITNLLNMATNSTQWPLSNAWYIYAGLTQTKTSQKLMFDHFMQNKNSIKSLVAKTSSERISIMNIIKYATSFVDDVTGLDKLDATMTDFETAIQGSKMVFYENLQNSQKQVRWKIQVEQQLVQWYDQMSIQEASRGRAKGSNNKTKQKQQTTTNYVNETTHNSSNKSESA